QERVNGELVGNVGNFVYRSLLFAHRNWDGTPDAPLSGEVEGRIEAALDAFRDGANDYSIREATQAGVELADFGNEYIQRNEPWHLVEEEPEAAAAVIRDCVQLSKAVAVLLAPTLPGKAQQLWEQLGEAGAVADADLDAALEAPPAEFGPPEELFEGIEDDRVAALNEKLAERVESAGEAEAADEGAPGHDEYEPISEQRVSFEEFQELDLRVAEVRSADPIEGADDLLRLEVDIGVETRQIVAGLRGLYEPDELVGQRIVVVANLEPTELMGVESDGMLLAAGEDADLLTTLGDSPPGTEIR
ncbi:MAG: methionine--tRNA ligase subunit beta, partial [Halobacteriaceae archaeon]